LNASKKKLEIFGLTSEQIQKLEKSREINITLTYFSPISGTVIEKKVQEGVYVNEGTAIYDVADLSTLWDIAEVSENDLSNIKIGNPVKLHLRAYPGEEFNGRVTFIYPVVNSATRTVKVRSEFSSLGGKLKPQMYGETVFNNAVGQGLLIPADAVIIAGKRAVIWTKTGDGMFEARSVIIGNRIGDKYQILSGIKEGDEIAATGGFLIDSESQLKTGMPTEQQHSSIKPSNQNMGQNNNNSDNGYPDKMKNQLVTNSTTPNNSIVHKGVIDLKAIDKNKDGVVFQDPMDWNVISDEPGRCPICNMKLKKVTLDEARKNLIDHGFQSK
jgi:Cu(I)/Ag(I) efflux system membrane fusion protein